MTARRAARMALAGCAAAAACVWSGGGDVATYEVRRGEFQRRVYAEGNLEAAEATVVTAPANVQGMLKVAWLAESGALVREHDLLVRFDPTDIEQKLVEAETARATADSRIAQTSIRETSAQRNLGRDADMAERELRLSTEFQSQDPEIFSRVEIIESEIDGELARRKKVNAEQVREIRGEISEVALDLLEIEKRKAQLQIDQAREELASLEVRAPHSGIFLPEESWSGPLVVGATVWSNNKLAEIPRLDVMQAKVWVLEADAGGIVPGLAAAVTLDARPGESFDAVVKTVDALPQRLSRGVPVQYFGVVLELERTEPEWMKPGQRVRAVLQVEELDDVLHVPRQTVFERDGRSVVYVRRGGGFEPVEVELGSTGLGRVVVAAGLAEGDRVALRDPTVPLEAPRAPGGEPSTPMLGAAL